jgi:hypothetical protein
MGVVHRNDLEFLNWGGGEGEKIQVDGMFISTTSDRNDFVQWMARNEVWEPGKLGMNPG